jgi:hypothetical protein
MPGKKIMSAAALLSSKPPQRHQYQSGDERRPAAKVCSGNLLENLSPHQCNR